MSRLKLPAVLAVVTLGSLSCTATPQPATDASRLDAGMSDAVVAVDQPDADVCPDPFACYGEFKFIDGSMNPVYLYRRDGSLNEVPCPEAPPQCPIA